MSINGIAIGDGGGIAVGPELVTYGTKAITKVWQHPKTAGIRPQKTLRTPKQLAMVKPTARDYTINYADGPIVIGYNNSRAVNEHIMASLGNLTTNDYLIGDGSAPDLNSITVWVSIGGGHLMEYVGCKATSVRWDFTADQEIVQTITFISRGGEKIVSVTVVNPDESGIAMAGDLTPITLGTNSLCILSGFIQVDIPHTGADRVCLGGGYIKEPARTGISMCTAGLTVELADETDNDTEAELDHYLSGTAAGDLVIGDFELTGCWVTGDPPALAEGIIQFPINLEGQTVTVTTTA